MTRSVILVDYENVGDAGLEDLPKNARILVFIGKTQHVPSEEITGRLVKDGKRIELINISEATKNNLDLHLAFYLGKILAEEQNAEYTIVSKDKKDFDPLVAHLRGLDIQCQRKGIALPKRAPDKKPEDHATVVTAALKKLNPDNLPRSKEKLLDFIAEKTGLPRPEAGQVKQHLIEKKIVTITSHGPEYSLHKK